MNEQNRQENERRIDHLESLVERETRTQRHLENNRDIERTNQQMEHVQEVQQQRREEINNLKNIIVNGQHSNNNQLENLEKRYRYTEGYLNHNADHMSKDTLDNTKEKQKNRKEQMDQLK
ncbi:MAG TPA: hypothetical protein VHQ24_15895 [Lachnospiraceae bacterium]|nr:hypothetical protein [Lachnospiraceae bacterium]